MTDALPAGWRLEGNRLKCTYEFADFVATMTFLSEVAHVAERHQHHPDFCVHWNRVDFTVWSHDEDAITDRDRRLVPDLAKVAERHGAKLVAAKPAEPREKSP